MAERDLSQYVEVSERIQHFRDKYPEGTLAPLNPAKPYEFIQAMGWEAPKDGGKEVMQSFVVVVAAAYRHPGDPNPGVGMAWEIFPGRTNFTRGSELQNAETSAWGRAIIAVGASDSKRGIASREEVRNRQAEDDPAVRLIEEARAMRRKPPEVDEHGAATQAEITRMSTGPEPGVERFKAGDIPVDDRWTSDAPSWLVGVDPPEDQPGSALPAQVKQIHAVYTALGMPRSPDRHIDAAKFFGADVNSFNDLSYQQAARLLENLHERHTGKMTRR